MQDDPQVGTSGRGSGLLDDERGRLQYMWMYKYVFDHPQWLVNSLLIIVCQMIPVVGPIVLLGYDVELLERLHLRPDRLYPAFDFGKFTDYLTRGIWPFLAALVCTLVMGMVMLPLWFGGMLILGLIASATDPIVLLPGMFGLAIMEMAVSIGLSICFQPIMLRAGLTQNFGEAFNLGFVRDYLSLVWRETVLSSLWLFVSGMGLMLLGGCVFCIGMYLAAAVLIQAQWHGAYQLYELYLDRGGKPIPLKSTGEI